MVLIHLNGESGLLVCHGISLFFCEKICCRFLKLLQQLMVSHGFRHLLAPLQLGLVLVKFCEQRGATIPIFAPSSFHYLWMHLLESLLGTAELLVDFEFALSP